jgi:hypothetical protein
MQRLGGQRQDAPPGHHRHRRRPDGGDQQEPVGPGGQAEVATGVVGHREHPEQQPAERRCDATTGPGPGGGRPARPADAEADPDGQDQLGGDGGQRRGGQRHGRAEHEQDAAERSDGTGWAEGRQQRSDHRQTAGDRRDGRDRPGVPVGGGDRDPAGHGDEQEQQHEGRAEHHPRPCGVGRIGFVGQSCSRQDQGDPEGQGEAADEGAGPVAPGQVERAEPEVEPAGEHGAQQHARAAGAARAGGGQRSEREDPTDDGHRGGGRPEREALVRHQTEPAEHEGRAAERGVRRQGPPARWPAGPSGSPAAATRRQRRPPAARRAPAPRRTRPKAARPRGPRRAAAPSPPGRRAATAGPATVPSRGSPPPLFGA